MLILSDYLCWLSGKGDLRMSFGADSGKSSTLTKIYIPSGSKFVSQLVVFKGRWFSSLRTSGGYWFSGGP